MESPSKTESHPEADPDPAYTQTLPGYSNFPSRAWMIVIVACAAAVPMALCAWTACQSRVQTLESAVTAQIDAVQALSEHTDRLLQTQALALDLIDHQAGDLDCPALRSNDDIQSLMTNATRHSTESLWLTNADGLLCMASDPSRLDTRSRAFREYVAGARNTEAGNYIVDRAVIGLSGAVAAFNIVKPRVKNGVFNGVILASVSLVKLTEYWTIVVTAGLPTQRVALYRLNGETIARSWPPLVPAIDRAIEQRMATHFRDAPEGHSVGPSLLEATHRVAAWRTLPEWGIVVSASVDETVIMAPWRQSVFATGLISILGSSLIALFGWVLIDRQTKLARTVAERSSALHLSREREHALRASELRLSNLIATVNMGTFLTRDINGIIRFWSKGCAWLLGWTSAEAVGKSTQAVLHTRYPIPFCEIVGAVKRHGTWAGDLQVQTRDGRELSVEVRITARKNPDTNETELLEVLTDVTALRQSEQRFRALALAAPEVYYAMSPDWTVVRELHGGGFLADLINSNDWLDEYIPSDEQSRVRAAIQEAISTKSVFQLEHRIRLADGTIGWTSSRAVPLLDAMGQVREWFGAANDITDRKRSEDALKTSEAELMRSHRLEAIGQLCAGVAHDFNNLIQGLISHLELIEDDGVSPATMEKVGICIRLAEQGGSLAHQLLSFGRKQLLLPQEIKLHEFLEDFCRMASRYSRSTHPHRTQSLAQPADTLGRPGASAERPAQSGHQRTRFHALRWHPHRGGYLRRTLGSDGGVPCHRYRDRHFTRRPQQGL